jgi:hypothetical protein
LAARRLLGGVALGDGRDAREVRIKRAFEVADASGGDFRGVAKHLRQRRARGCM